MAKKRTIIGNVTQSQDGKSFFIKVNDNIELKKGDYLNLENEKSQLSGVDYALAQGWIKDENEAEKRREQIKSFWNDPVKTKDGKEFVRSKTTKYQVVVSKETES